MTSTKEEPRTANTESEAERRHREGAAAVAAQEHGWFENLTELDGKGEGSVEGLTPEGSGEPKTLTPEEAFAEATKRALVVHFYESGYVEILVGVRSVGFKAKFLPALSEALGVPVVARDEASELRAAAREWVRATDEFRRHVRETEALPENEGMGHAPIQAALDLDHAEAELRRLAGGENER